MSSTKFDIPKKCGRMVRAYEANGYAVVSVDDNGMVTMQWETLGGGRTPADYHPKHQQILIYKGVAMLNRLAGEYPNEHRRRMGIPIINGRALGSVHEGTAHFRRVGELTASEWARVCPLTRSLSNPHPTS